MAAHVLRLRLALLFGALRGPGAHTARVLLGFLGLVVAVAVACFGLLLLNDASDDVLAVVTLLGGSAIMLGFALGPLLLGADDPLDPRRFRGFTVGTVQLAAVLALAGFLSVPILCVSVLAGFFAGAWIAHGVAWPLAASAAVLGVASCVLLARAGSAIAALVLRERRSRELTGVLTIGLLVVVVPAVLFFASLDWGGWAPTQLADAAEVLAVTPLGAAWAIPAAGAVDAGVAPVAVALLSLAGLAAAWGALVHLMLTTTPRPLSQRARAGLGWFAVAPTTPGGAIAARSIVYWSRDGRYIVNIVVIPIAAALTIVPLAVVGVPAEIIALVPVPIMALFLGWLPHNDLAYDSTAVWMHIASGVRGVSDRLGRLVPVLLFGVPLLAVAIPLATWAHGRWAMLPAVTGVCAALFLSGLGVSSIVSVASPYPVTRPGDSAFEQPQRTGGALTQAIALASALVLSAPAFWWAWVALTRDAEFAWTALWGGLGIGVVVLIAGIAIGAVVFDRGGGRLMEFAEAT